MDPVTTRKLSRGLGLAALGLSLAIAAPSHAATITTPGPETGLGYEWQVVMGGTDSGTYSGSVGAKSWAEPGNPDDAPGWTHTSDWTALDLTGVSGPTLLTLTLDRGATGSLFPAFSLYSGWELAVDDTSNHTFNNTGNISWATSLTYIDHLANAGGPIGTDNGTGVTSVSRTWALDPGLYSLNFGGNPAFALGQTGSHDFTATLTTAPVPVPAALYLFGSGLVGLVGLARRKMTA
jgi:hypothetical protein